MGATHSTEHPHTLSTPIGVFNGIEQRDKSTGQPIVRRYFRIPYAQPPTGQLRWRRPQPLPMEYRYDGDNTAFGPICPQPEYAVNACRLDNPEAIPEPELTQSEDCLYLNIWVPTLTAAPAGGWPVQFHIHGGWLQMGSANQGNEYDPFDLFKDTTPRIIVSATYRLNLFGFLAGQPLADAAEDEAIGNYGFWDQRLALEWVYKNIAHFNGNPQQITVGGLSAGANSTFFQLFHDSHLPEHQRIIKRVYLWSNSVAIQPNSNVSPALTDQFHELCSVNNISPSLSAKDKLSALRAIPGEKLAASITRLKMHTFRASTDNSFIPKTFLSSLHSGAFTTLLAKHKIGIMIGEVGEEKKLYGLINPPKDHETMVLQLQNYYPAAVCDRLISLYSPADGSKMDYVAVFSRIVADMQVHSSLRGFTHLLLNPPKGAGIEAVPARNVHRYRICWRAKSLDEWILPEVGVTHAVDGFIWWGAGWRTGFTEQDKHKAIEFLKPFGQFLNGSEVSWGRPGNKADDGAKEEKRIRLMDSDGVTKEDVEDELWDWGIRVWDAVWDVQKDEHPVAN